MVAPTFKKASDSTTDSSNVKYGAQDLVYAFNVLDGQHATDRIQVQNIESVLETFDVTVYQSGGNTIARLSPAAGGTILRSEPSANNTDRLVLQAAFDIALSASKPIIVWIKPGTYKLGATTSASSFFIYGNTIIYGYGAILQATVYNKQLLRVKGNNSNIMFFGITFDFANIGDQLQIQGNNTDGVVSNILIQDCLFTHPKVPVVASDSNRYLVLGMTNTGVGTVPAFVAENCKIINCDFDYTLPTGTTSVTDTFAIINLIGIKSGLVQNNRFWNIPATKGGGIFVYAFNQDIKIVGNHFYNTDSLMYGGEIRLAHSTNTLIAGNTFSQKIRIVDSRYATIVNNYIRGLIQVTDSDDESHDGGEPVWRGTKNVLIANNQFDYGAPLIETDTFGIEYTNIHLAGLNNDLNPNAFFTITGNQARVERNFVLIDRIKNNVPEAINRLIITNNHILQRNDTTTTTEGLIHFVGNTAGPPSNGIKDVFIRGNYFAANSAGSTIHKDIELTTTGMSNIIIRDNVFNNTGVSNINTYVGSVSSNYGIDANTRNSNSGTATITTSNTSVVVTHELGYTPLPGNISVNPTTSLGSASSWWFDTITATQFTIRVNTAPGSSVSFAWQAQRNE
jgi:hypothetical protein